MKKIIILLATLLVIGLTSCDNFMTRNFGGATEVRLQPCEKLVEVTWKENNLWYLVEPMEDDYVPKTKVFKENSNAGMLEGTVTFIERR